MAEAEAEAGAEEQEEEEAAEAEAEGGGGGRPHGGDEAAARSREAPEPREVHSRLPEKLRQHCVKRERAGGGHRSGSGGDMDTPCVLRVLAFATAAQLFANALTAKPRPVKALAAGSAFRSQAAGALTAPRPRGPSTH